MWLCLSPMLVGALAAGVFNEGWPAVVGLFAAFFWVLADYVESA